MKDLKDNLKLAASEMGKKGGSNKFKKVGKKGMSEMAKIGWVLKPKRKNIGRPKNLDK